MEQQNAEEAGRDEKERSLHALLGHAGNHQRGQGERRKKMERGQLDLHRCSESECERNRAPDVGCPSKIPRQE